MTIAVADDEILNFAYGSNLTLSYVHEQCPSTRTVMHAQLPNYSIQFRRYSTNMKGGISTIIETPGGLVRGAIYAIRRQELDAMDVLENVGEGLYLRQTFRVLGEDGAWHLADLYRVAQPAGPFPPAQDYLALMVRGAQEHALPDDYIVGLRALEG
ncbi:MAG: gamma-glutamylcyclotransferase [Rhodospirillaceae bacterium]|nr:gamma-glutamylcyclotransferase [Rhodospirillaceae bacterium]